MSKRSGYSEEKTSIFGKKYTQHYDDSGRANGRSEEKTDIFGNSYTQHHDESGSKTGHSEEKKSIFGSSYTKHYDEYSRETGRSEETTNIFGGRQAKHYNNSGGETGRSEEKTGLLGNRYAQHYGNYHHYDYSGDAERSDDNSIIEPNQSYDKKHEKGEIEKAKGSYLHETLVYPSDTSENNIEYGRTVSKKALSSARDHKQNHREFFVKKDHRVDHRD